MSSHPPAQGELAHISVPLSEVSTSASSLPDQIVVTRDFLGSALATRETEHRLAEEKAQADFARSEKLKDNDVLRRQRARQALFELCRDGAITVVVLGLVVTSLIYTGPWIVDTKLASETRQFATALWTLVFSGSVGYLFGTRKRAE